MLPAPFLCAAPCLHLLSLGCTVPPPASPLPFSEFRKAWLEAECVCAACGGWGSCLSSISALTPFAPCRFAVSLCRTSFPMPTPVSLWCVLVPLLLSAAACFTPGWVAFVRCFARSCIGHAHLSCPSSQVSTDNIIAQHEFPKKLSRGKVVYFLKAQVRAAGWR